MLTWVIASALGYQTHLSSDTPTPVFKAEFSGEGLDLNSQLQRVSFGYRESISWASWFQPVIPALRKQRQADHYRLRHCRLTPAKKSKFSSKQPHEKPWVMGRRLHCSFKDRNNVLTSLVSSFPEQFCQMFCSRVPNNVHPFPFCSNSDDENSVLLVIFKVWAGMVAHVSKSRLLEGQNCRITGLNLETNLGNIARPLPSPKKIFNPFLISYGYFQRFRQVLVGIFFLWFWQFSCAALYSEHFPSLPSSHPTSLDA